MPDCEFYKSRQYHLRTREIGGGADQFPRREWCTHPDTPLTEQKAMAAGGGRHRIGCDGCMDRCVIDPSPFVNGA